VKQTPEPSLAAANDGTSRASTAAGDPPPEWVRLPGLFSWDEVRALFSSDLCHGEGWRFSARLWSDDPAAEPLYVIHATLRHGKAEGKK